ncbi:Uncharacterised protein [Mycobacteroides abscessus subsp. abscessus]|nr:Uncharacterised protein [Mycobacteroides abscessus subsp. abscessus]SKU35220.1 Uncharacterised protein [Mycobacteroides abscessus subsp. abscessus]
MALVAFTPTASRCGMCPIILNRPSSEARSASKSRVRIRFSSVSAPTASAAMIALQITPITVSSGMP